MVDAGYFQKGSAETPQSLSGTVVRFVIPAGQPAVRSALAKPGERGFLRLMPFLLERDRAGKDVVVGALRIGGGRQDGQHKTGDRKSVGWGKSVAVSEVHGGRRILKKRKYRKHK